MVPQVLCIGGGVGAAALVSAALLGVADFADLVDFFAFADLVDFFAINRSLKLLNQFTRRRCAFES
jgi:hypothetical protein